MRCLEDVKKELECRISDAKAEMNLWKNVKILKKKDGTDFANRSKSFENAKWIIPTYSDEFHPELIVRGYGDDGQWHKDTLYMYLYCDSMSDSDARKELGKKSSSIMRATYVLNTTEAYCAIQDRIASLAQSISIYEEELKNVDAIYNKFFDAVRSAFSTLTEDCKQYRLDEKYPSTLEYQMCKVLGNISTDLLRVS